MPPLSVKAFLYWPRFSSRGRWLVARLPSPPIDLPLSFSFSTSIQSYQRLSTCESPTFYSFFFSNSFSHAINSNWCFHFVAAAAAVVVVVWICCLLSFFAIDFIFLCRHFSFLEGRYRQTDFILFFKRIDLWINDWKIKTQREREREGKWWKITCTLNWSQRVGGGGWAGCGWRVTESQRPSIGSPSEATPKRLPPTD